MLGTVDQLVGGLQREGGSRRVQGAGKVVRCKAQCTPRRPCSRSSSTASRPVSPLGPRLHGRLPARQVQEGQHIGHQALQAVKQPLARGLAEEGHKEGGLARHLRSGVVEGWWVERASGQQLLQQQQLAASELRLAGLRPRPPA